MRILSLLLFVLLLGCSSTNQTHFWRETDGRIIVDGPLLGPFERLENLAPQLCEKVKNMPGASAGHRRGGQEYCGVIYQRPGGSDFFASHPSYLGPPLDLPGGRKACYPPDAVKDTAAPGSKIYADYHSHPAVSTFSPEDLKTNRQRFYFRMMFNTACEIYLYDLQARMVSRLQEGVFVPFEQVSDQIHGE